MKIPLILLFFLLVFSTGLLWTHPVVAEVIKSRQYCGNIRQDYRIPYCIQLPQDLFRPARLEGQVGRIETFDARKGDAQLVFYYDPAFPDVSRYEGGFKEYCHREKDYALRQGRRVTYARTLQDRCVLSGFEPDGKIFYTVYLLEYPGVVRGEWTYSSDQKELYNPLVASMAKTFRVSSP